MIEIYDKALDNVGRLMAGTTKDKLDAPAPAHGDARTLINHMIGGCYMFSLAAAGQDIPAGTQPPDFTADDHVAAFEGARKLAVDAFKGPDVMSQTWNLPIGAVPVPRALGIGITEAVVHGWDLAKATGQPHGVDPQVAEFILGAAKQSITDQMRSPDGHPFAPEVPVPDDADSVDKLMAFLGRKP